MSRSKFGHISDYGSDGRYRVMWRENGKRRSKILNSKVEAIQYLDRVEALSGKFDSKITYRKYYNTVMYVVNSKLAARTQYSYNQSWKVLDPLIGDIAIEDTDWHLVQRVMDSIESPDVQRYCLAIWKKTLNYAIRDNLIGVNPCCQMIKLRPIRRQQKRLYTREELHDVLQAVDGTEFAMIVALECCCGLRHEEYAALNRSDFEFTMDGFCLINIDKALTEVNGSKVLKEPKNESSVRQVVAGGKLAEYISHNVDWVKEHNSIADYKYPFKTSKRFKDFCQQNDVLWIRCAWMRSVFATLSAEAGCIDSIVSMSMGHAGRNTKEQHYQFATVQAMKINAQTLSWYIFESHDGFGGVPAGFVGAPGSFGGGTFCYGGTNYPYASMGAVLPNNVVQQPPVINNGTMLQNINVEQPSN